MFHLSDLLLAAGPVPWTPPEADAAKALVARYRRQRLATHPDDAPELKLPDAKYLTLLESAALAAKTPSIAAAVIGACLEAPVLAYASAAQPDSTRRWYRLCLLSDLEIGGLLCVKGKPGKRGAVLREVSLEMCDLSDLDGIRRLVADVYMNGDRPERDVRDRGRETAPHAVWLGAPAGIDLFARRLQAIGALAGYRVETLQDPIARTKWALQRTADLAPELVICWLGHCPAGDFVGRAAKLAPQAVVEPVDAIGIEDALAQAAAWCAQTPVVARGSAAPGAPKSMKDTATRARDHVEHLVITDQAVARASQSPYESPDAVLDALLILDEIAGGYAAGDLDAATFQEACDERGLLYSRDITAATRDKHGARYTVPIDGGVQMMGPHLRFGGSYEPRFCARVYWWMDRAMKRLVIGHIGEHLPGARDQAR